MLFIDNPIGVGFSYANNIEEIPTNEDDMAALFYFALSELYTANDGCFKKLNMTNSPLFIFGESYAGKYIPAIAYRIFIS